MSLDTGLNNILPFESVDFGPGHPYSPSIASDPDTSTNLLCEEWLDGNQAPSKKRVRSELGRIGRNIRQKLLCGFFSKEGNLSASLDSPCYFAETSVCFTNGITPLYPNGFWEADPKQLPQQPCGS